MSMKIGIIGSGVVGQALAKGFLKHGHAVMIGTNNKSKHAELKEATDGKAEIGSFADTAAFGDIIVLAVKGTGAESAVEKAGVENLKGKTVLDATNPIADEAPVDGVLKYFTGQNESLMEKLQANVPEANFVKAFSSVGNAFMVNPDFGSIKPTMFICGNDDNAKVKTKAILDMFGWETADMGTAAAARAIEPLAMLWCIPGFRENSWTHAFKLLKLR